MTAYHVALKELASLIEAEGLDPASGRAILLMAERPEEVDGFDVWEVETDVPASDGLTFCDRCVPAAMLRRAAAGCLPRMGM